MKIYDNGLRVLDYDPTSGYVTTPHGKGKYVAYDSNNKTVYVEIDGQYIVSYPADKCYIDAFAQRLAEHYLEWRDAK